MRTKQPSKANDATPSQPDGAEVTAAKPAATKSAAVKGQDKVGRGRPPRKSQYQPGQTGNPRGRPPGQISLKKAAENAFSRKVSYEVDGKTVRISMLEAMLIEHGLKAVKGDAKSAGIALNAAKVLAPKEADPLDDTTPSWRTLPSRELFAGIDEGRLLGEDMIEFSRLSAIIDHGGLFALSPADFALARDIRNRALGKDTAPENHSGTADPS